MRGTAVAPDGVTVSFEERGAGEPALVFVHGWSCDRHYWRHQIAYFGERRRVVAVDLGGHGESARGRTAWTMPSFGDDVAAVCERLAMSRVVLVGHSMGGDVVVEAALRLPGRVAGVVWVDTYRTLGEPRSPDEVETFLEPFRTDFGSATREFVRSMFLPDSEPELVESVADDMASAPVDVALSALQHAVTCQAAITAGVREIDAPVVALNPDYRPTDVEALARHGVETVPIPGLAHFPMLEDPALFNRVLEETLEALR